MITLDVCPLCERRINGEILSRIGRNQAAVSNVVCKDCGFVFQNPRLTSQETLHLYRETDYMQRNYHAGIKQIHDAMTPLEEDRLNYLTPFVPNWPRVSLLEIGPGAGSFLRAAADAGCAVNAVEADPGAAAFIADDLHLPVVRAFFPDYAREAKPSESYDVVVALHVFEHVAEPGEFLRAVSKMLKPGGLLFLEVPNILRAHTSPEFPWFEIFDIGHIYSYSPSSLRFVLEREGGKILDVMDVRIKGHNEPIRAFVQIKSDASVEDSEVSRSLVNEYCAVVEAVRKAKRKYHLRRVPYFFERTARDILRPLKRLVAG